MTLCGNSEPLKMMDYHSRPESLSWFPNSSRKNSVASKAPSTPLWRKDSFPCGNDPLSLQNSMHSEISDDSDYGSEPVSPSCSFSNPFYENLQVIICFFNI